MEKTGDYNVVQNDAMDFLSLKMVIRRSHSKVQMTDKNLSDCCLHRRIYRTKL